MNVWLHEKRIFPIPGEPVCAQSRLVLQYSPIATRFMDIERLFQASIMRSRCVEADALQGTYTGFQFSRHRRFLVVLWRKSKYVSAVWPEPTVPEVPATYHQLIPRRRRMI